MIHILHLTQSLSTGMPMWVDADDHYWKLALPTTLLVLCQNCGRATRTHWVRLYDDLAICPACIDLTNS